MARFYPANALIPQQWQNEWCLLRPLAATDVEQDFDAVMGAGESLRASTNGRWPRLDFTLAEDLEDLQRHEADFEARRGFTYTVLNPQGTRCLGCVYIYPPPAEVREASGDDTCIVRFWLRPECVAGDWDSALFRGLRAWLDDSWQFQHILWRAAPSETRHIALYEAVGLKRIAALTFGNGYIVYCYG